MRLYLARHGESEANVLRVISNRGLVHPLTELGQQEAVELERSLAPVPITAIYSSPLLRARQTAETVASARGLPWEIVDALREPDCGIAEGRSDEGAWAEHRRAWTAWMVEHRHDYRIEGGESLSDVWNRFAPFLDRLLFGHGSGDHLLLVTHGALIRTMLSLALADAEAVFAEPRPIPNSGTIVVERRAGGWVCMAWCGAPL